MNQEKISNIIISLERTFSILNRRFYNDQIVSTPAITITPGKNKALGWCSCEKVWKDKRTNVNGDGYYEINICADCFDRPFSEIVEIMLHEMAHLYSTERGIKTTSRNGTYHNKKYKEVAEKHGLVVTKDARYGFALTELSDEAKAFVASACEAEIDLYRISVANTSGPLPTGSAAGSNSRKYQCPGCGQSVRATKEVHVDCGFCHIPLQLVY